MSPVHDSPVHDSPVHDWVAIGAGPFNLALACLAEPVDGLDGVVLEARDEIAWHPGMMLPDATLQVPFLADLVTMADPTSRFSFLNFLKRAGRLYPFYIRESFYPLRAEYDAYCRWAADQLPGVRLGRHVESVEHDAQDDVYVVRALTRDGTETYRARHLVLGIGTQPAAPPSLRGLAGPVLHSAHYLDHRERLRAGDSITIVGSGQSAAEVYRDLLEGTRDHGYHLTWLTRSPRFFSMEYTKLTLEMTSPEWSSYFHTLPRERRDRLVGEHKSLYKGISGDLVDDVFDTLYRLSVDGPVPTTLRAGTSVTGGRWDGSAGRFTLDVRHDETGTDHTVQTQGLVLATGYRAQVPSFVDPIRDRIRWDELGRYDVARDWTVDAGHSGGGRIFVQNAEEHTHGFVAPDLGMGAHRASAIVNAMAGRDVYEVEQRIAFQEFGPPDGAVRADASSTLDGAGGRR